MEGQTVMRHVTWWRTVAQQDLEVKRRDAAKTGLCPALARWCGPSAGSIQDVRLE
ncbi:MAG: hypothetical protein K9J81_05730 [Desulfohalobiaceae bacterium]|nr:hypothetical protein [Desulfohalobiaceae bacterium]